MHEASYDPLARFDALAHERTSRVGGALIAAADALRDALADTLEAWEDETAAGESLRHPADCDDVRDLFALVDHATRLARAVAHRRSLSFVLATEAA